MNSQDLVIELTTRVLDFLEPPSVEKGSHTAYILKKSIHNVLISLDSVFLHQRHFIVAQ